MAIIKNYDYVVKNPDTTLDHHIKNIIAGFPGVGKSTAAKMKNWLFLDMESSDYHWVVDNEGNNNKVCHPEWPINYVDAIMEAARDMSSPYLYILISTHNEVLAELDKRCIYYNAVLPRSKDIYLQRYRERGNTEEFIAKLDTNFDVFIKSVESTNVFGIYYTDDYLYKIFVTNDADEYPYKVLTHSDRADICHYEFKAENLPTVHTNKPIVVVADPAMVRNSKYLDITSVNAYLDYLKMNSITATEQSYTDFIKNIANSPINRHAVFVEGVEEHIIEFCKNKLNFILAIPETYVPSVHTYISSRYGNSRELFDAYVGVLKCYSFRTMVSDFYIDDVYENVPNVDSICLIKAMDSIVGITSSEIAYNPEVAAFSFRDIILNYLETIEEDTSDEE